MWDISDEVAIPISHRELIQLFTKSEFSDAAPTRTSIIFPPRSKNGIMTTEKSVDSELLKKKLKISIQSSSADFPKPRTKTLKEIMDSTKDI